MAESEEKPGKRDFHDVGLALGLALGLFSGCIVAVFVMNAVAPHNYGATYKHCTLPAGFSCWEYAIDENGYLNVDLSQSIGRDITVTAMGCSTTNSTPPATRLARTINVSSGGHGPVAGYNTTNRVHCCTNLTEQCRAKISIEYNYERSNTTRTIYGDVLGPLENLD
ncbi:Uncharacterised protein [uncultured archaeon]|nr:Uncharacterised protein [uncultured archaeon]